VGRSDSVARMKRWTRGEGGVGAAVGRRMGEGQYEEMEDGEETAPNVEEGEEAEHREETAPVTGQRRRRKRSPRG
jgi:hypothetical protein